MTVGQKETITYRGKVIRVNRSGEPFLPPHGVGYGLKDGLGVVLNRVIRRPPSYRGSRMVCRATGTVVEETSENVVIESRNGRRLKIRVSDIIRRTMFHND